MSTNKKTKYNRVEAKNNMDVSKGGDEEIRSERKSLDKVVTTEPKKIKRSLVGRLISGVLGPEGLPGVGQYISEEIVVPAIKNIIVDTVTSGINMVMYGDSKGGSPRNHGGSPRYTGYSSSQRPTVNYSSRYTSQKPEPLHVPNRNVVQSVEEYVIETREDAAHVLTTLTEQADMYGSVSIADYYDLIGVPSNYTDNNYGWLLEGISHSNIRPVRGGFVIKFPPVEVI